MTNMCERRWRADVLASCDICVPYSHDAVRTFTALVDVVANAVAAHTNEEVADSARKVLGYQIWDHHIRAVPEHEHESKEEHDERAKYG